MEFDHELQLFLQSSQSLWNRLSVLLNLLPDNSKILEAGEFLPPESGCSTFSSWEEGFRSLSSQISCTNGKMFIPVS